MSWIRRAILLGICSVVVTGCGSALNKDLDDARFALDKGDYAAAITSATAASTADTGSLNAFNLLSAAHSGQSGLNLLTLTQTLTTAGNSDTIFNDVHDELVTELVHTGTDFTAGFASLNTAITTLTGFTGTVGGYSSVLQKEYYFQQGILMYIQALGLPTITAQPSLAGAITPASISAANATTVQGDFISGYAALANAATSIPTTNVLLTTLSKNYCVLKNASVATGTLSGISVGVLRDLTACQLDTTSVTTTVATCATFVFGACDGTTTPAL